MRKRPQTILGKLGILSLCFLILAGVFYWIVEEDWSRTSVTTDAVSPGISVGAAGSVLEQTFEVPVDAPEEIRIMPEKVLDDEGTVEIQILREGEVLFAAEQDTREWQSGKMTAIPVSPALDGLRGERVTLRIGIREAGLTLWAGNSVTAGKFEAEVRSAETLTLDGVPQNGQLVMSVTGINRIGGKKWFWPAAGALWACLTGLYAWILRCRKNGKPNPFLLAADLAKQYRFLMKQLISRDFKVKYKASVFGFLWSFLNPLLMMAVYSFVFSTIFRSNVENFPVYLLSGIVLFNFFSDATNLGLLSITGNAALITKVYIPKYILPISKVFSTAVNLVISLVPLLLVMLVTGVRFTKALLLLPFVIGFLVMLAVGVSLILSAMTVFFRDMQFLWGILITILNFVTPIFYPESIIPAAFRTVYHLNPLYQILFFMRSITLHGVSPTPVTYLYCLLASALPLAFGLWIFRRQQDRFVLYL